MKPMIKYRGGKSGEIPYLLPYIPEFQGRYIEPFFGGGAMFFYLEPRRAIVNDINPQLINFYRGVRDGYEQLRHELDVLGNLYAANRAEFDRLKAETPQERVHDANETLYYHIRNMYNNIVDREFFPLSQGYRSGCCIAYRQIADHCSRTY